MGMQFGTGSLRRTYGFGPYQEFETPYRGGYNISYGGYVTLRNADKQAIARIAVRVERRGNLETAQEATVRELEPWAPAILKFAAATQIGNRAIEVRHAGESYFETQDEGWSESQDEELVKLAGFVLQHATPEERSTTDAIWALAENVANRLDAERQDLTREATNALPDAAAGPIPDMDEEWQQVDQLHYLPWLNPLRAAVMDRWAKDGNIGRDNMIKWAVDHGASKADLHRRTGIARTTINRVLGETGD